MLRRRFLAAGLLGANGCGRQRPTPVLHAAERAAAVRRGMEFIYQTSLSPKNFKAFGSDYLWCFYGNSVVSTDADFSAMCRRIGLERAAVWRQTHSILPPHPDVDLLCDFAFGSMTADLLGLKDERLKYQIRQAVPRLTTIDFLGFDPLREAVPADIPKACAKCKAINVRGAKLCHQCGSALVMTSRFDVYFDALVTAYSGNIYGMRFGADYADVIQHLPSLRPYPTSTRSNNAFFSVAYAVTHVVYTMNDYGYYRLRPEWFADEYNYLRAHFPMVVDSKDPETLGEFLDTLRAFGAGDNDPMIRDGIEYLLAHQNPDGSWGDPNLDDVYIRYHTTWTSIGGLLDYAWHGERVRFPAALLRLRQVPTWHA